MSNKLYMFEITRFVVGPDGDTIQRSQHNYQVPAASLPHAYFKLGATYHRYEIKEDEVKAKKYAEETREPAIVVEFDAIV